MSIHKSFKSPLLLKRHRSVLTRLERIKILQQEGRLTDENFSVVGLPKVKHQRIKLKVQKEDKDKEKKTLGDVVKSLEVKT